MAIAGLARRASDYAMAIVFVAPSAHGAMAITEPITETVRNAITQPARQQQQSRLGARARAETAALAPARAFRA